MEITKIIMPKTDPDVLRELANKRLEEIRSTQEYKDILEIKTKHNKIEALYVNISYPILAFIAYIIIGLSALISVENEFIYTLFSFSIALFMVALIITAACLFYKMSKLKEKIDTYTDSIEDLLDEYMISDVFEDSKYNFVNCGYIIDIDHLKEFIKDENASYIITHPIAAHDWHIQDYCKNDIILCKVNNGIVTDKLELDGLYENDIKDIITENNELNLTYMDKNFWVDTTPYWE